MANFIATTVTDTPAKIKEGKQKELDAYLAQWTFEEDVTADTDGNELHIYGYGWLSAYKVPPEGEDVDFDDASEEFLRGLVPFIDSIFSVVSVGAEKCRYACGTRVTLEPDGNLTYISL